MSGKRIDERSTSDASSSLPQRPAVWSAAVIEHLEWQGFEALCCAFYRMLGIPAETAQSGPDGGTEMRLFEDVADQKRCTAVVHCKLSRAAVTDRAVGALLAVMTRDGIPEGILMAPKGFTHTAHSLAAAHRITLIDGQHLVGLIEHLAPAQQQTLLELLGPGDWSTPACPICGEEMRPQVDQRGPFWACSDYPTCSGRHPAGTVRV